MDTKKIVSFIVLLGGEAINIAAFILFRGSLAPDVLVLNIVVSSVIYGLFFLDILVPWINLNDKQGKKVGSAFYMALRYCGYCRNACWRSCL